MVRISLSGFAFWRESTHPVVPPSSQGRRLGGAGVDVCASGSTLWNLKKKWKILNYKSKATRDLTPWPEESSGREQTALLHVGLVFCNLTTRGHQLLPLPPVGCPGKPALLSQGSLLKELEREGLPSAPRPPPPVPQLAVGVSTRWELLVHL